MTKVEPSGEGSERHCPRCKTVITGGFLCMGCSKRAGEIINHRAKIDKARRNK